MSNRFDYIAYDEISAAAQARCKAACIELEAAIEAIGGVCGREQSIALTQLEHVYARCGRAIRNEQIIRDTAAGRSTQLQEGRGKE